MSSKGSSASSEDSGQYLGIIVDTNFHNWEALAQSVSETSKTVWSSCHTNAVYATMVDQQFVFINCFLLLHRANEVRVIATCSDDNVTQYPPTDKLLESTFTDGEVPIVLNRFGYAASRVKGGLQDQFSRSSTMKTTAMSSTSLFAGALTKCLLAMTSSKQDSASLGKRVLVISASKEFQKAYMQVMNGVFFAQKNNITIDAVVMQPSVTVTDLRKFQDTPPLPTTACLSLQQAAHLTEGTYLNVLVNMDVPSSVVPVEANAATTKQPRNNTIKFNFTLNNEKVDGSSVPQNPMQLGAVLIHSFLSSTALRKALQMPKHDTVDLRASCVCHQNPVSTGYLCQVCLAVYCTTKNRIRCEVCGTRYLSALRPPAKRVKTE